MKNISIIIASLFIISILILSNIPLSIVLIIALICVLLHSLALLFSVLKEKMMLEEENQYFIESFQNIRNPISLTNTPLSLACEKNCLDEMKGELSVAIRNLKFLDLHLSNLMELKHLFIHSEHLDIAEYELGNFMKNKLDSLLANPSYSQIILELIPDFEYASVWIDKYKISPIIDSFIINAIENLADMRNIRIIIIYGDKYWEIKIKDSCNKKFLEHYKAKRYCLLNRLFQKEGKGKGILVKKLLNLCKGEVLINNNDCSVSLRFPIDAMHIANQQHLAPFTNPIEEEPDIFFMNTHQKYRDKHVIVLADNDEKYRQYLEKYLSKEYIIKSADNGLTALELIKGEYPDLVICDISLSKMDGDELSSRLKTSRDTSFIPIILLGSQIDIDQRRRRQYSLADTFMFKSFHPEDLKIEISVLINNSRFMRRSFLTKVFGDNFLVKQSTMMQDANVSFLNEAKEYVLAHLEDEDMTIDDVASKMCMSRTTYFNKWKSLTGEAPKYLIYRIRMEKARELLESGNYTVNEIPEMVGLKNLKNFRNRYKEYFGKTPRESIKSIDNK